MKRILISYDLMRPGQDYNDLISYLKSFKHTKPLLSTWLISTTKTAEEVRDEIVNKQLVDGNDKLIAIDTTRDDAAWHGKVDWLRNNQL